MSLREDVSPLVVFAMIVRGVAEIQLENWFCGQNQLIRLMSYHSMIGDCWKYAPQVNHCCALHDNCYDLQMGRESCDKNFCDCLKRATASGSCLATEIKCHVSKSIGHQAYYDAASYREPPDFVKVIPSIDGIEKDIEYIYQECPKIMLSIKSCSLIANICLKRTASEDCKQHLADCIHQTAKLQNTENCWKAVAQMKLSLGKSRRAERSKREGDYEGVKNNSTLEESHHTTQAKPKNSHVVRRAPHTHKITLFTIVFIVAALILISLAFFCNFRRMPNQGTKCGVRWLSLHC